MAKPYGDDLRRKFLFAYDQGEETLEELADRFLVSVGWEEDFRTTESHWTGRAGTPPAWPQMASRRRGAAAGDGLGGSAA
jgi:hypothetical protein